MAKFPIDADRERVIEALEALGFALVRRGKHIAMKRENTDGTVTPLTMPDHRRLKSSTLRTILNQSGISREEFLEAYERS